MIRGALRRGRPRAIKTPSTKFSFICSRPSAWPSRGLATPTGQGKNKSTARNLRRIKTRDTYAAENYEKSNITKAKTGDVIARLDACLPPHLRTAKRVFATNENTFVPDATRTALVALQADKLFKGFFTWLAIDQGRWRAAVWIVKLLVEHFHAELPRSTRLTHTVQEWARRGSLNELTDAPLYLVPHQRDEYALPHMKSSSAASLHELTDDKPDTLSASETLRHDILGLVWRGIGRLIISCTTDPSIADGGVKPEILEMIALLHHYELMPSSIYTYVPAGSEDAIQQPPTLHLLSSRIFTALSDATWKAREMTAVEEAKKKGGDPMRLEAKGSSYRIRVSGIKPEIWLELILWSCLHGGWILDGSALLGSLCRSKSEEQWKPISWRDSLKAVMPVDREHPLDWDSIKYMFDTRSSSTMDGVDVAGLRVDKTISSEVVNAYIDALLNVANVGIGKRGVSLSRVTRSLHELRLFLQKADLNLGGGSWDAMILRLVESSNIDVSKNPAIVRRLVELSPRIGEELSSRRSQVLPSYVLDGSAAILGLLHRAIYAEIKNNNLEGALQVFQLLQERVDDDRHRSIRDFFEHNRLNGADAGPAWKESFTDNFSGIDYPSFDTQIPPETLGAFLNLVTESKAFEFGKWMLKNGDVDGPIIPARLYREPPVAIAIVNFAIATDNNHLLSQIVRMGSGENENGRMLMPNEFLQALLNTQIDSGRWDAATRLLEHMRDNADYMWSVDNAAALAKVMIAESRTNGSPEAFARARDLLTAMLTSQYGDTGSIHRDFWRRLNFFCFVLSTVDDKFALFIHQMRKVARDQHFALSAPAFNSILEGVLLSQGSQAGCRLVETFLPHLPVKVDKHSKRVHQGQQNASSMPRTLHEAAASERVPRKSVKIANPHTPAVRFRGGLKLSPSIMQIVCSQALREFFAEDSTQKSAALDTFAWAILTLRIRGVNDVPVREQLKAGGLTSEEMEAVREKVAAKFRAMGSQVEDSEGLPGEGEAARLEEGDVVGKHGNEKNADGGGDDGAGSRDAAPVERFI